MSIWAIGWRTDHELEFVKMLEANRNRRALTNYIELADYRDWGSIDKAVVVSYAKRCLEGMA